MKSWLKLCGLGARFCARCVLSFAVWTLWLALLVLLGLETWIATSREFAVPGFVLRAFEERLAASHVQVKFGHARFDPSGHILIEGLRVSLPAFEEPVVVTQAALLELDPWALLAGRFEPRRLHLSGGSLMMPAMLTTSGRPEAIIRELDATFQLADHELTIEQLTARVAGIAVVARGALHLAPASGAKVAPLPVADYLASHFPDICRQLVRVSGRLALLDEPQLQLELSSSGTRGAIAAVTVLARGLKLEAPVALQATGLRLTTRFPLQGEAPVMAPLTLTVDNLQLAGGVSLHAVRARLRGMLKPALYTYEPREVLLSASRLTARGFTFTGLSARLEPGPWPRLAGELVAQCTDSPLALRGQVDFGSKTARLHFEGTLAPALLGPIGEAVHKDVRPFVALGAPVKLAGDVTFDPGWKFTGLTGQVATKDVDASSVHLDAVGGEIEFDGRRLLAHHAFARLGENFARGSFFQDFQTLDYRFLLAGQLRPLAISGWFGKWWPSFFRDYEFPVAPPEASVDVTAQWRALRLHTVFVYADSTAPVIHGVKFDHARTLLFIRPNYLEGLEVFATIGSGSARGTFARQVDPAADNALISLDLDFDSTLELHVPGQIFGPVVADLLTPYRFAQPPEVRFLAHFDGPASPDGVHQLAQITARSIGAFAFHDFPLSNLSFHAALHDDDLVLDRIEVGFAGGTSNGRARVWGRDADRRLGFDCTLRNASLGQAVTIVESYTASQNGRPPPVPGKFVQDKASVKLDLAISAEGLYSNPYSFQGTGNASLSGDGLGEVRMLGLLSELLSFTSLRFTSARASFRVDGPKLTFPRVNITGANSAIDAHGSYELDRHDLDFKARVNPFQESTFLPAALLGAVLSPFSSVLEVKLTGQLDKPAWAFVNGPTNFLRNLSKPPRAEPAPVPAKPAPDYLKR
jgi:hypothetical protein